ncbi:MAG: hypothetical protein ACI845_003736 [Gammaproteobacteria bacterium]|jgi:hypothetical protein
MRALNLNYNSAKMYALDKQCKIDDQYRFTQIDQAMQSFDASLRLSQSGVNCLINLSW